MHWIGVLVVAPIWGYVSTQLFLQIWLSIINATICIIGLITGQVDRKKNVLGFAVCIGAGITFSLLLNIGYWLISDVLSYGYSNAENIVYWISAAFSAVFFLYQFPGRLKKNWRKAMIPGALEEDIYSRRGY